MKKILKLRFLLPLLGLGYVVGIYVVVHTDLATGHVVLAVLAALGLAVTIIGFFRYDSQYREASIHRTVFTGSCLLAAAFTTLFILHIIALGANDDGTLLFIGEGVLIAVSLIALLLRANQHEKESINN